ncbi:MAG: FKBP-type peptidyl-prolyl cis-trans isomerase [Chitinophagaceae bacterium]
MLKKIRLISVFLLIVVAFPDCSKNKSCKLKSVDSEAPQILAYAAANGINATRHSSGLYYEIVSPGSGPTANSSSKIKITYTGKFMDGQTFDEQLTPNATPWDLNGLIQGWIIGIPLIQEGGHIKLIVPSSLAYGCDQYYSIPGSSVLFFDINLIDVQ